MIVLEIFNSLAVNVVQIFVLKTHLRIGFLKSSIRDDLTIKRIKSKVVQTISLCDVTFWQVYLLDWWPPECRLVSENGLALLTRLRSSVLRIFTSNPFLCAQFLLFGRWKLLIFKHQQHQRAVVLSKCKPRGQPHSPWPSFWSDALFIISFQCLYSPFNH